jgi:hypothetical protein
MIKFEEVYPHKEDSAYLLKLFISYSFYTFSFKMDTKNIWTPSMRDNFIHRATTSDRDRESMGPYWFNVMPKLVRADEEIPQKAVVTNALMDTVFSNPEYRIIALKIYDILVTKMVQHPFIRDYYNKDVVVVMKGGTSYTYVVGGASAMFPYSDLDVIIYINPYMGQESFSILKDAVKTVVLQTISQYKRAIDNMFFSGRERTQDDPNMREAFLSAETVASFKRDHAKALEDASIKAGLSGSFISPFENIEYRNMASRYSCMITANTSKDDAVVRVELPHYPHCERIPLRKTPLFCSFNDTIKFNRSNTPETEDIKGSFDLFRLRFNNMFIHHRKSPSCSDEEVVDEEMVERGYRRPELFTADFVDISIPNQDDTELIDFWNHGRTWMVRDDPTGIWLTIPDMDTMKSDLWKMLNIYECPEGKKEKRRQKYDALCLLTA